MRRLLAKLMRPGPRECAKVRSLLSDYADGQLAGGERRKVERHLRLCARCSTVLVNFRHTLGRLRDLGREPAEDEDIVRDRVVRDWRDRA